MRYKINDLYNSIAQKCGKSYEKLGTPWEIYGKSRRHPSSFVATAPRSRSSTKLPVAKVTPSVSRLTSHWAKPSVASCGHWGTMPLVATGGWQGARSFLDPVFAKVIFERF